MNSQQLDILHFTYTRFTMYGPLFKNDKESIFKIIFILNMSNHVVWYNTKVDKQELQH